MVCPVNFVSGKCLFYWLLKLPFIVYKNGVKNTVLAACTLVMNSILWYVHCVCTYISVPHLIVSKGAVTELECCYMDDTRLLMLADDDVILPEHLNIHSMTIYDHSWMTRFLWQTLQTCEQSFFFFKSKYKITKWL